MARQSSSMARPYKSIDPLQSSMKRIKSKSFHGNPKIGIVLGSGLGLFGDSLANPISLPYSEIEGFPAGTVEGHRGRLIMGSLKDKDLVVMQGRFHLYEGYNVADIVYPIRVLSELGVSTLIVTNAAGGIKKGLSPGDFMVIIDHVNLTGENPLVGIKTDESKRSPFVDMTLAYDTELIRLTKSVGKMTGIGLSNGVLASVKGPSYETPAEIKAFKRLGADAVCMSTIHEVIMARYLGMRVLGLSVITNYAAGISAKRLTHQYVIDVAGTNAEIFSRLINGIVECIKI